MKGLAYPDHVHGIKLIYFNTDSTCFVILQILQNSNASCTDQWEQGHGGTSPQSPFLSSPCSPFWNQYIENNRLDGKDSQRKQLLQSSGVVMTRQRGEENERMGVWVSGNLGGAWIGLLPKILRQLTSERRTFSCIFWVDTWLLCVGLLL